MIDGSEDQNSERLRKLRDAMTAEDIRALRERFDIDPGALSQDELGVLGLVLNEKLRAFEAKARRKLERTGGGSSDESQA